MGNIEKPVSIERGSTIRKKSAPVKIEKGFNKIIHRIYFDDLRPYQDYFQHFLATWYEQMPNYEIRLWNSSNLDLEANKYVKKALKENEPVFLSEYFRWQKLREYGGLYMDADIEVINGTCLNDILEDLNASNEYDAILGVEKFEIGRLTAQTVAVKKGAPLVHFMCQLYEDVYQDLPLYWDNPKPFFGPDLLATYFKNLNLKNIDGYFRRLEKPVIVNRVKIFPQEYFSPKFSLFRYELHKTENTCLYHLFSNLNAKKYSSTHRKILAQPMRFHELEAYLKTGRGKFFSTISRIRRSLKIWTLAGRIWRRLDTWFKK